MPQLNRNVGVGGLDQGLCLIVESGPNLFDINTTEFGLKQCQLNFATFFPLLYEPKRGTPCPNFTAGNTLTSDLLAQLGFLAAQSTRIKWNGAGDGVHVVEVLCEGAIFDDIAGLQSVFAVPILDHGSGYTSIPSVVFAGGDEVLPAVANVVMMVESVEIVSGGIHHFAGDILTFSGGTFLSPAQILVEDVAPPGVITAISLTEQGLGSYSAIPSNPVTAIGPRGNSATFNVRWRLAAIIVTDGGKYLGTPIASLSGGSFDHEAALGLVRMAGFSGVPRITRAINPVSLVKDTVEFQVYKASVPPGTTVFVAKAAADSLPAYSHDIYGGFDLIYGNVDGALPQIDGQTLSIGQRILLLDGTPYGGLYVLIWPGSLTSHWILVRDPQMDTSAEVSSTVYVQVADGDTNAGKWHCTVGGGFVLNTNNLTFEYSGVAVYVPQYAVTIDYRALELHWEYVTEFRRSAPLFLRHQYVLDNYFRLIANPLTGERFDLLLDSVVAEDLSVAQSTNGVVKGLVKITPYAWLNSVNFVGVGAQFEQTESGQYHHVRETATIKIVGAPPIGSIVSS